MMTDECAAVLRCPVCGAPLVRFGAALHCEAWHWFDMAREGYVNLLGGGRRARDQGDSGDMVRARRRFLDHDHYRPLLDEIGATVRARLPPPVHSPDRPTVVLDVGCGEGYYAGHLARRTAAGQLCCLGLDISKDAVRLAARRYRDVLFVVGDVNGRLPLDDGAVDLLLDVFAPRNPAEFARVVAAGGTLIVAIPAPHHLAELRALVPMLEIEADKEQHVIGRFADAFTPVEIRRLEHALQLEGDALRDLATMTPNYRHLTADRLDRLGRIEELQVTAAFTVLVFERRG